MNKEKSIFPKVKDKNELIIFIFYELIYLSVRLEL